MASDPPRSSHRQRLAALVLPAIPIALLALLLLSQVRGWATDRATEQAARSAELIEHAVIAPVLTNSDFSGTPPTQERLDQLDAELLPLVGDDIVRLRIWDARGTVVYSDLHDAIGERFEISHDLEEALAGEIHSGASSLSKDENLAERDFGRLLEVYVPHGPRDAPIGAVEFYLSYEPIDAAVSADFRRVGILVAFMTLLLYVGLAKFARDALRARQRADVKAREAGEDPLTGLANRRAFDATLARWLEGVESAPVGVLLVDLDDFKMINDSVGHAGGDEVLRAIAHRLSSDVREDELAARLGGDEFAILLRGADADALDTVGARVLARLRMPVRLSSTRVTPGVSIGSASTGSGARSAEDLLANADAALYAAKAAGKGRHVSHRSGGEPALLARQALEDDLRNAVTSGEIRFGFDAVVTADDLVTGFRARLVWSHPRLGLLDEDEFLAGLQRFGLVESAFGRALRAAAPEAAKWRAELGTGDGPVLTAAISPAQLFDATLSRTVEEALRGTSLAADDLRLEIAEPATGDNTTARANIAALVARGTSLAMGDGRSSAWHLAPLLDGRFCAVTLSEELVGTVTDRGDAAAIAGALVDLAHTLGMEVVAAGVSTPAQRDSLAELGVDRMRGALFARGLTEEEAGAMLLGSRDTEVPTTD